MTDVIVIGGGITGCAAAEVLARRGLGVTLLERRAVASMASGWTLAGVRQSGRHPAELPLARAAVEIWGTLDARLGCSVDYRRKGNLRLARTPEEVEVIRALVAQQRAMGLDLTFLPDNAAVRAVAPAISRDVLAASFCPSDGHADPVKATRGFAAAARRAGADIREGVTVRNIRVEHGRACGVETDQGFVPAGAVIAAAGVNTPALLEPLGLCLPVAVKLVSVVQTEPVAPCFDQVFGVANADCAGRQQVDGRFRFTNGLGDWTGDAAGWTEEGLRPSADDVAALVALVARVLPAVAAVPVARCWGGLIDLTPDALPVLDRAPGIAGLVIAAGFSGHGFCLGPVSGEIAADLATDRTSPHDLSPFAFGRFAARTAAPAELTLHG